MPVEPTVPSYIVSPEPGFKRPSSSAYEEAQQRRTLAARKITLSMMLRATLSLGLPPAPFRNYRSADQMTEDSVPHEKRSTSAFPSISHPVRSDKDLILNKGVFPMHDSIPSGMSLTCPFS